MAEITETLLSKKLEDSWNRSDITDNFAEEKELTVTITLSEYRRLVASDSTRKYEIDEANKNKWEREDENKKLKATVSDLRNTLLKYRAEFGELPKEEEEE